MQHAPDDSPSLKETDLADEAATLKLGAALAEVLRGGPTRPIIYLCGDLGAGKTTLVRGLLRALGHAGKVKSPTYTLVELYAVSGLDLYHFDFYRFSDPQEYLDGGLDEYFRGRGICLVEWPDKAFPYLAAADLQIDLTLIGEARHAALQARSEWGRACLNTLSL